MLTEKEGQFYLQKEKIVKGYILKRDEHSSEHEPEPEPILKRQMPVADVPRGGWVKLVTSRGKAMLLERVDKSEPQPQPQPEPEPEPAASSTVMEEQLRTSQLLEEQLREEQLQRSLSQSTIAELTAKLAERGGGAALCNRLFHEGNPDVEISLAQAMELMDAGAITDSTLVFSMQPNFGFQGWTAWSDCSFCFEILEPPDEVVKSPNHAPPDSTINTSPVPSRPLPAGSMAQALKPQSSHGGSGQCAGLVAVQFAGKGAFKDVWLELTERDESGSGTTSVGDFVSWTKFDSDIPKGSVGVVVSVMASERRRVRFFWPPSRGKPKREFDITEEELKGEGSLAFKTGDHSGKVIRTAQVQGCSVAVPKQARKGREIALRLDLAEKDSAGQKKFVISFDRVENLAHWMNKLSSYRILDEQAEKNLLR